MAKIERKIVVSSDMSNRVQSKGTSIPPWYNNYDDTDKWYNASNNPPDYAFFYNSVGDDFYIQYGKNQTGWASARFFGQTIEIISEEELPNGDIKVEVRVKANFFVGRRNDIAQAGFAVRYDVTINGVNQYVFTGNTYDNFTYGGKNAQTLEFIVKPQQTITSTAMIMEIKYPNGEFNDRSLLVGVGLFNPNPPTYIPMAIRKNGNWKDLNTNKGKILIRKGSNWIDKSEENINTSREIDKGKNRIRKSGNWRQLPPMENDKPI